MKMLDYTYVVGEDSDEDEGDVDEDEDDEEEVNAHWQYVHINVHIMCTFLTLMFTLCAHCSHCVTHNRKCPLVLPSPTVLMRQ